jgi:hypothetical protein
MTNHFRMLEIDFIKSSSLILLTKLSETGKVGLSSSEVFNNKFPSVLLPAPYKQMCNRVSMEKKKKGEIIDDREYLFFQLRVWLVRR